MKVLISLIGSNPLPIYTVCRYAAMEERSSIDKEVLPVPDKHLFVYTNNTKSYFDNMMDVFDNKGIDLDFEECNLKNDQHYGDEIIKHIDEALKEINKEEEITSVIINNTGGTKPMAVYSTMAVLQFIEEQKRNIEELECYLDSSTNNIRVNSIKEDKVNASSNYCPKNGDLREILTDIDISDILLMHKMEHEDNKNIKPKSYKDLEDIKKGKFILDKDILKKFAKVISEDEKWKRFERTFEDIEALGKATGKHNVFEIVSEQMKLTQEEINGIKEIIGDKIYIYNNLTTNYKNMCIHICNLVNKEENSWIKSILPIFDDENMYSNRDKAEYFYKFITGVWLEHYLLIAVEEAIEQLNMKDKIKVYPSLVCRIIKGSKDPNFEVDLVLLKGYEIIAFTCTTAGDGGKYLLKSKAFEVLHRVEQLGGEHAKLVSVNMSKEYKGLENELTSFNSSFYKNSKFITRNHIGDYDYFVSELKDILRK